MKKTLIMLSLCALLVGCTKDWGTPTTRNYPINGPFTGLEVSDAFQVTMSDQVTDVVVTVGDVAHKNVEVKVVNGKLHIGFKPNTMFYNGTATAVIPASLLYDLNLSGASSFTGNLEGEYVKIDLSGASIFSGNVSAGDIDFDLSGASSFTGIVEAEKLEFDLSGASTITVEGYSNTYMELDLSGATTLNAANLETPMVFGNMSGGSFADVTCCSSLNVELSGGSTLVYGLISNDCQPNVNCPCTGGSIVRPRM